MNKRKSIIIMLIVFLAIGFATVSTTLVLNGILAIGENKDDFNIIFTSANLNGIKKNSFISEDKKHINFVSNELKTLEDKAILTYEVTNTSRNYDADVSVTCSAGTTELITFEYTPHQMEVLASETKTGSFTASMFKVVDTSTDVPIECTLTATAKEREELGEEYIAPFSKSGVLMVATNDDKNPEGMWSHGNEVTKVIFENKLFPHETTEDLIYDVSEAQDKSVMAYLVSITMSADERNDKFEQFVIRETGMTIEEYKKDAITNQGITESQFNSVMNDLKDDIFPVDSYELFIQSNTGVKANPNSARLFTNFVKLREIEGLDYFDTSSVINMSRLFCDAKNLMSIDLSKFDTRNVTNLYGMFMNCELLNSLDLRSFNTEKVTYMSSMFWGCLDLISVDLSSFNTSNVTSISSLFLNCERLTSVDVSGFDTTNMTDMSQLFMNCKSLKSVDVSNFNTSKVTRMESMFMDCYSLTSLDVTNFDTSKVTSMDQMFHMCYNLTELDVSNFDTSRVTNMKEMFRDCRKIEHLDVSHFKTTKLENMYRMFYGCKSLKYLDVSVFDTSNVTTMYATFSGCQSLTSLDLSSFNTSKVTKMSNMFEGCNNMVELDLSNFDTARVEEMSLMFCHCEKLAKLDVSSFNVENVTTMYGMFDSCKSLTSLDLSNFVTTSLNSIGNSSSSAYGIFADCEKLSYLDISNFNFSNVANLGHTFESMPTNAIVKVKNQATQDWILALTGNDRPSSWTIDNVQIKEA